jgi:hypothetical protein
MLNYPPTPKKRYVTTITLSPPRFRIFVDSWEEAEEQGSILLKKHISEEVANTTIVIIAPLERVPKGYGNDNGNDS